MSAFYIRYPSSGGSGSTSTGVNGLPAPGSSTLVGGVGIDGNLHPFTVTNVTAAQVVIAAPGYSLNTSSVILGWDGTNHREISVSPSGQLALSFADVTTTGTITSNQSVTLTSTGLSSVSISFTGVWTGPLVLEASIDGVNFFSATGVTVTGGFTGSTFSSPNNIQVNASAFTAVRMRGNVVTSGTATVFIRANSTAGPVVLSESLPQGGNQIGLVGQGSPAAWVFNQTQVGGASITLGQKTMAASYPVVLASDQSGGGTINVSNSGFIRANAPTRIDYTVTPVTTAAYVQLVASTTLLTKEVEIFDSSGQTLVLATGAAAAEVDQMLIFPGGNSRVKLAIPAASRVSIKAVSATANVGEIDINFYG